MLRRPIETTPSIRWDEKAAICLKFVHGSQALEGYMQSLLTRNANAFPNDAPLSFKMAFVSRSPRTRGQDLPEPDPPSISRALVGRQANQKI